MRSSCCRARALVRACPLAPHARPHLQRERPHMVLSLCQCLWPRGMAVHTICADTLGHGLVYREDGKRAMEDCVSARDLLNPLVRGKHPGSGYAPVFWVDMGGPVVCRCNVQAVLHLLARRVQLDPIPSLPPLPSSPPPLQHMHSRAPSCAVDVVAARGARALCGWACALPHAACLRVRLRAPRLTVWLRAMWRAMLPAADSTTTATTRPPPPPTTAATPTGVHSSPGLLHT